MPSNKYNITVTQEGIEKRFNREIDISLEALLNANDAYKKLHGADCVYILNLIDYIRPKKSSRNWGTA